MTYIHANIYKMSQIDLKEWLGKLSLTFVWIVRPPLSKCFPAVCVKLWFMSGYGQIGPRTEPCGTPLTPSFMFYLFFAFHLYYLEVNGHADINAVASYFL